MGSREDVAALKRLVGEAFRELLDARTRLKALEEHTGLARAFTMGSLAAAPKSQRATQWSLRLNGGASSSAPHAAPLLELCADTSLRKGSDTLSTSLSSPLEVGESGVACGAFTLTRLAYRARLSRRARLLLVGAGAEGCDAASTLNPAHGAARGLLGRHSSAVFREATGGAHFAPSRRTLLQATWRPAPRVAVAVAGLAMGAKPAVGEQPATRGLASLSGCAALGESVTLGGWLCAALPGGGTEWALSLAPAPPGAGAATGSRWGWGLVAGRPKGGEGAQAEAFLALGTRGGEGWTAIPSLLLTQRPGGGGELAAHLRARCSLRL